MPQLSANEPVSFHPRIKVPHHQHEACAPSVSTLLLVLCGVSTGGPVKCGYVDLRIFKVVKCREILRMLWVKCGCGNADMSPTKVCYCLPRKHDKELPEKNNSCD